MHVFTGVEESSGTGIQPASSAEHGAGDLPGCKGGSLDTDSEADDAGSDMTSGSDQGDSGSDPCGSGSSSNSGDSDSDPGDSILPQNARHATERCTPWTPEVVGAPAPVNASEASPTGAAMRSLGTAPVSSQPAAVTATDLLHALVGALEPPSIELLCDVMLGGAAGARQRAPGLRVGLLFSAASRWRAVRFRAAQNRGRLTHGPNVQRGAFRRPRGGAPAAGRSLHALLRCANRHIDNCGIRGRPCLHRVALRGSRSSVRRCGPGGKGPAVVGRTDETRGFRREGEWSAAWQSVIELHAARPCLCNIRQPRAMQPKRIRPKRPLSGNLDSCSKVPGARYLLELYCRHVPWSNAICKHQSIQFSADNRAIALHSCTDRSSPRWKRKTMPIHPRLEEKVAPSTPAVLATAASPGKSVRCNLQLLFQLQQP